MTRLRIALLANGIFSSASGLLIALFASSLATDHLHLPPLLLQLVGLGLVAFGAGVIATGLTRKRTRHFATLLISMLDFGWVLLTVPIALSPLAFTPIAKVAILSIALLVGLFATAQIAGLDDSFATKTGHRRICFQFQSEVPADILWNRLAELDQISRFIPDLHSSRYVSGNSLSIGAVRECIDVAGQRWREECTEVADRSFTLRFDTEAPDYPYPLTDMHGGWRIEATPTGSLVEVWWTARGKSRMPEWLLFPIMAAKAERSTPTIITCLEAGEILEKTVLRRSRSRLRPGLC
jgi:hypothetical protein